MWHHGIQNGRKWRQREEIGSKISPKTAKNGVFALNKVKLRYTLSKEIIRIEAPQSILPCLQVTL